LEEELIVDRKRTDLPGDAVVEVSAELRKLQPDVFARYLKAKNFPWHMNGSHFRDYHLLLDEQSKKIFAMTDDIAERARKVGARPLNRSAISRSISA
jgi:starvation-inducible DNA-binding protein